MSQRIVYHQEVLLLYQNYMPVTVLSLSTYT